MNNEKTSKSPNWGAPRPLQPSYTTCFPLVQQEERAPRACGDDSEQLQQHVGHGVRVGAFWSTGACDGAGFNSDVEWRIYAPKGTRGMYVEPISASGNGDGISWDGVSGQRSFGRDRVRHPARRVLQNKES